VPARLMRRRASTRPNLGGKGGGLIPHNLEHRVLTPALTPPTRLAHVSRADAGTRTPDPFITSEVLYQLSYVGAAPDASAASA
jgi:hypothetical protein